MSKPRAKVCHSCCVCGVTYVRRDHLIAHVSDIYKCGGHNDSIELLISMKANVALLDMFYRHSMRGTTPPPILRMYVENLRLLERIKYLEAEATKPTVLTAPCIKDDPLQSNDRS